MEIKMILGVLVATVGMHVVSLAATNVSGTACNFPGIQHAVCNNASSSPKCKCAEGYKEGIANTSSCVKKKVSETVCTKDAKDQCKHFPHALCDNDTQNAKCKCSDDFAEDKTDGSTCVKIIGAVCTTNATCMTTNNVYCNNGKCTCKSQFGEKNNVCVQTVSGTSCTSNVSECNKIKNSHCDNKKCACNDGFVMNVDVCSAESGATSMPMQTGNLAIVVCILAIGQHLFW